MSKIIYTLRTLLVTGALCCAGGGTALAAATASMPYENHFDSEDDFSPFTVIDGNSDYSTWKYNKNLKLADSDQAMGSADDWLISPAFALSPEFTYELEFDARPEYYGSTYKQELDVLLGQGTTADGYTTKLGETLVLELTYDTKDQFTHFKYTVTVAEADDYSFAFHLVKTGFFHGCHIDNIKFAKALTLAAPATVTDFTGKAGEKGALTAEISFTAPVLTAENEPLSEISYIEVYRDDKLLTTISDTEPGRKHTITDADGLTDGIHRYRAIAYAGEFMGAPAEIMFYVGTDTPVAPAQVYATDNRDGKVLLSWDIPTQGINGGYVDPDQLLYNVGHFRYGVAEKLGVVDGNSIVVEISAPDDGQQMVIFAVSAFNSIGESELAVANEYVVGKPYELPFYESFPGGECEGGIWILKDGTVGSTWSATNREVFDYDGGSMVFFTKEAGEVCQLESGKISLKESSSPKLVYRVRNYYGQDVRLRVLVRANGQIETSEIQTIDFNTVDSTEPWLTLTADLDGLRNNDYISVIFEGTINDVSAATIVDGIEIRDVFDKDIRIEVPDMPQECMAGKTTPLTVRVTNMSDQVSGEYETILYIDDEVVATAECTALAPFASATHSLRFVPPVNNTTAKAVLEVKLEGDRNPADNTTARYYIDITPSDLPVVVNLANEAAEDGVMLTWQAPVIEDEELTEDFESYNPFAIDNIGDWILTDADRQPTDGFGAGRFPNSGDPFAYIVFNPSEIMSLDNENTQMYLPHSGRQYMAAVTVGEGLTNDNWLISPRLNGKAQTVSFYARSLTLEYGAEQFEILYSTTGTETTDFILLSSHDAPARWTEFTAMMPEGARYFAIRHTSGYVWMFMVDDVTYTPQSPVLKSFNVYRDGEKVARSESTSYLDQPGDNKEHSYNVTCVYDNGESSFSDTSVYSPGASVGNIVVMSGCIRVYTLSGIPVWEGNSDEFNAHRLAAGSYIVVDNNSARKIFVQ